MRTSAAGGLPRRSPGGRAPAGLAAVRTGEAVEDFVKRIAISKGMAGYHKGLFHSLLISADTDIPSGARIELKLNLRGIERPLTVVGTEFGDDFVVAYNGIYGAGLPIRYAGIDKVAVDAMEGNDTFFIDSTGEGVQVELYGGLGSDMTTTCIVLEEIAKASPALAGFLSVQIALCPVAVNVAGTDEQKQKYLLPSAKGENLMALSQT